MLQPGFFRYLYLYDLKVCRAYRGQKIGALLMDKAREIALQQGSTLQRKYRARRKIIIQL